ncbi:MAG: FHA domain-containing protein [Gammaproteobacteria bacterium]
MAKLIVMLDGSVVQEFALDKERITIGRKPNNDIQLDDATVSGQHAAVLMLQHGYIEDLNSTNGTYLNGKRVSKRMLSTGDVVKIGQHEFKYMEDEPAQDFEATVVIRQPAAAPASAAPRPEGKIKILSGPKAGEMMDLAKSYTTVGKPGVQVAVIARRAQGYFLTPMSGVGDGTSPTKLNEQPVGAESHLLKDGDVIEVAGTRMQFNL